MPRCSDLGCSIGSSDFTVFVYKMVLLEPSQRLSCIPSLDQGTSVVGSGLFFVGLGIARRIEGRRLGVAMACVSASSTSRSKLGGH